MNQLDILQDNQESEIQDIQVNAITQDVRSYTQYKRTQRILSYPIPVFILRYVFLLNQNYISNNINSIPIGNSTNRIFLFLDNNNGSLSKIDASSECLI